MGEDSSKKTFIYFVLIFLFFIGFFIGLVLITKFYTKRKDEDIMIHRDELDEKYRFIENLQAANDQASTFYSQIIT